MVLVKSNRARYNQRSLDSSEQHGSDTKPSRSFASHGRGRYRDGSDASPDKVSDSRGEKIDSSIEIGAEPSGSICSGCCEVFCVTGLLFVLSTVLVYQLGVWEYERDIHRLENEVFGLENATFYMENSLQRMRHDQIATLTKSHLQKLNDRVRGQKNVEKVFKMSRSQLETEINDWVRAAATDNDPYEAREEYLVENYNNDEVKKANEKDSDPGSDHKASGDRVAPSYAKKTKAIVRGFQPRPGPGMLAVPVSKKSTSSVRVSGGAQKGVPMPRAARTILQFPQHGQGQHGRPSSQGQAIHL
eukprot:gnl/MRDRNA2_/MRDRNA2_266787_c0_seq1.p1 gnl/MRDRNA2_/MRDRNA2_266787_c0~~gnl/MRDRNA2_/MRDRNA2_266787_c0_seq1.p1  ORF type:complete len:302 (-),score=42.46 gnl/MRDRNA2_/MRDRNA2_266787_c0_seq1:61-966(-)